MLRAAALALIFAAVAAPVSAQGFGRNRDPGYINNRFVENVKYDGRFTFARLSYTTGAGGYYYRGPQVVYVQPRPRVYYQPAPVYYEPQPVYVAPPPPVVYAPVGYRDDDWRAREWREHEWRRREWREHEWRERRWHDRDGWRGGWN